MAVIARCGVCDRPATADLDPIIEGAIVYCGPCALAMRDDEIEVLRHQLRGAVSVRDAAEKVSAAWDAWINSDEDEGQDAVAEAIGELRTALGGQ